MPIKRVQFPDGSIKRIEVPDGTSDADVLAFAQQHYEASGPTEVEMPDGTVVEFPAGIDRNTMERALQNYHAQQSQPSEAQMLEALRRADAAGNVDDARRLARAIQAQRAGSQGAGAFDDLIPQRPQSASGNAANAQPGAFDDLIPAGNRARGSKFGGVPVDQPWANDEVVSGPWNNYQNNGGAPINPAEVQWDPPATNDLGRAARPATGPGAQRQLKLSDIDPSAVRWDNGLKRARNAADDMDKSTFEIATPFGRIDTGWHIGGTAARTLAGAGESLATTIPGIKQAVSESTLKNLGALDQGLRYVGANDTANWLTRTAGVPMYRAVMNQRQQEADRREQDAALNATWSGRAGMVGGTLAQMYGPGGLAKLGSRVPQLARFAPMLEATSAALVPKTVRGNAGLGFLSGYVQPAINDADRAFNTTVSGLLSTAGAAVPRAAGATVRAGRNALNFLGGAERRAVDLIRREATNPQALLTPKPSAIPGVARSLFEESLDPGVARLETYARGGKGGTGWVERDAANNAARVHAVQGFAGDKAALDQALQERSAAVEPLYAAVRKVTGVDTSRLVSQIDRLVKMEEGRPAIQSGLNTLRGLLHAPEGLNGNALLNIRQTIGDMLGGRFGGDGSLALKGSRTLLAVRDQLDRVLSKSSPEFAQANRTFNAMSQPIQQMQLGQTLLKRATGSVEDPLTQLPVFSASKLGQQLKSLDTTARTATGFRKAKAGEILMPEHMATLNAVADDTARAGQRLKYGSGGGSHTASQTGLLGRLAVQGMGRYVPGVAPAMEFLQAAGASRVQAALNQVLQNPAQYRAIHATLKPAEQSLLEQALIRVGGGAGRTAASVATH